MGAKGRDVVPLQRLQKEGGEHGGKQSLLIKSRKEMQRQTEWRGAKHKERSKSIQNAFSAPCCDNACPIR